MITITELLQESVDTIFEDTKSNMFTMSITIRNYDHPDFEIPSVQVELMQVNQLFDANTTDDIQLNVNIQPVELLSLVKYQSSLYAELKIEYIDWDLGEVIIEEEPEVYLYRVFIHDLENIAKRYNIMAFLNLEDPSVVLKQTTALICDIKLQLIADDSYKLNKAAFIGIMANTTVANAIGFSATCLGVERINMIPPHNNEIIHRLNIPPNASSFKTMIGYIQDMYGVYSDGLSYYFRRGTLFVYPKFDIAIDRPRKLRVLKINPDSQAGLPNYFVDDGDLITVVSNTPIIHAPASNVSVENDGNSKVYIAADKMIDGQVTVNGASVEFNDITRACTNNVNHGIMANAAIPSFENPTINMFKMASEINGANTELLLTGWAYSRLFRLSPGMPVEYVYDEEDRTVMVTGILEGVATNVTRMKGKHSDLVPYNAETTIMMRLDLDTNKTEVTSF